MEKPTHITNAGYDYTCTLQEIVTTITSSGYDKKLNITNDCCYSGGWCHKAKEIVDDKTKPINL